MESKTKDLWVFVETNEDGTAKNVGIELLTADCTALDIDAETENVNLEGAEIIASGGRGVGGPEGFEPIRALAKELGATVGASRAAVDAGWIAHAL